MPTVKVKTPADIKSLARRHTQTALNTLKSIAACRKSPAAARVAASVALLDRGWGRASQYVEVSGEVALERIERVIVEDRPAPVEQPAKPLVH